MPKQISQAKTKKILRDGSIGGKKLTAKQRRFFGFIAGGAKSTKTGAK